MPAVHCHSEHVINIVSDRQPMTFSELEQPLHLISLVIHHFYTSLKNYRYACIIAITRMQRLIQASFENASCDLPVFIFGTIVDIFSFHFHCDTFLFFIFLKKWKSRRRDLHGNAHLPAQKKWCLRKTPFHKIVHVSRSLHNGLNCLSLRGGGVAVCRTKAR